MRAAPPFEVVLVQRRPERFLVGLVESLSAALVTALLGGLLLMLLLPIATETFGWRLVAPGYWTCVALLMLARGVVSSVCHAYRPLALRPGARP